jgi:glycosyltransferase involved in cell wall biosynthesis
MIYFYPHSYLRDRQLDTIREWPENEAINKEVALQRRGSQVSREAATTKKNKLNWKQILPLINVKRRPKDLHPGDIVYLWGGLMLSGKFIVDLDNPWSLVGYNPSAMRLYRGIVKRFLLSERCERIYCISQACRQSLKLIFGEIVFMKAEVRYPTHGISVETPSRSVSESNHTRFLFVGSQFEIKGGAALLEAYQRVHKENSDVSLTIITHLPAEYRALVSSLPNIEVFAPEFDRQELFQRFFSKSDVLVHPSFMESFGMTILEAMAHGVPVISNDIYAISEMVVDGETGYLLVPPISKWSGFLPNDNFTKKEQFVSMIRRMDQGPYIEALSDRMIKLSREPALRQSMQDKMLSRFKQLASSAHD